MTKQALMLRHLGDLAWVASIEFVRVEAAARAAGKGMEELARATRHLAYSWWLAERRRRIWFWRGLIGDYRTRPLELTEDTHRELNTAPAPRGNWWNYGRRTGELLAGMIR